MSRKKKQQHEEEGGSERWLVSYADFITLLFAFFTTLYAISTVDAQKMGKMVTSMRASFDSAVFDSGSRTLSLSSGNGGSALESRDILPPGASSLQMLSLKGLEGKKGKAGKMTTLRGDKDMGRFKRSIESLLGPEILKGMVRLHVDGRGLVISLGETGVFDSGSDQLRPEGRALVDTLATSLVSLGNFIRIEGHTDNVPIHNAKFPSNWELSTSRATVVVSYMIAKFGMRPDALSAAGYAEYRPVAENDTEEGKARNRRVDIIVLNPTIAAVEPH
ncbi:MAG: flagellar motor protein MotB [Acidobacteriota bacterium]|nr:flagellar motor protein MotB [Acidobacteriota bacterium]